MNNLQEIIETLLTDSNIPVKSKANGRGEGSRIIKSMRFFNFLGSMKYQICRKEPYLITERDYKSYRKNVEVRQILDHYLDTLQLDIELTADNKYILTPTDKLCEKREAYKTLFNIK